MDVVFQHVQISVFHQLKIVFHIGGFLGKQDGFLLGTGTVGGHVGKVGTHVHNFRGIVFFPF